MLQQEFPDLSCCPLLPCLVQILLLYLSEADVLQVAMSLVKEAAQQQPSFSTYLLLSPQANLMYTPHSTYARLQRQSSLPEQLAVELIKDMMDNLLLPYTRKEHCGHVLSLYLVGGIRLLAKLTLLFLQLWTAQRPAELNIASARTFCIQIDFTSIVPIAQRIKLNPSSHSALARFPEAVSAKQFDRVNSFLSSQGLRLSELTYSSSRDGIALHTLLKSWDSCEGPHVLLFFAKPPFVVGVFLDRRLAELSTGVTESACVLFQADPEWKAWTHKPGEMLRMEWNAQGVSVGGAMGLEVPLADGWSEGSAVFGSPALLRKQRFSVFFVEVWRAGS